MFKYQIKSQKSLLASPYKIGAHVPTTRSSFTYFYVVTQCTHSTFLRERNIIFEKALFVCVCVWKRERERERDKVKFLNLLSSLETHTLRLLVEQINIFSCAYFFLSTCWNFFNG